jgi:hypothetical protein
MTRRRRRLRRPFALGMTALFVVLGYWTLVETIPQSLRLTIPDSQLIDSFAFAPPNLPTVAAAVTRPSHNNNNNNNNKCVKTSTGIFHGSRRDWPSFDAILGQWVPNASPSKTTCHSSQCNGSAL